MGRGGRLSEGKGSGDVRTDSEILSSGQLCMCVCVCVYTKGRCLWLSAG